jgi:hypothetical protein
VTDSAVAVSSEPRPKTMTEAMRSGRRPIRSASGPLTNHADEAAGDDGAEDAARDAERRGQRRRDVTHRLRVEAVHEHDEGAHDGDQHLVAPDRTLVDEPSDVEGGGGLHFRPHSAGSARRRVSAV